MEEQINNRVSRSKKAKRRKLITIIVLLLLCIASTVYILAHFGNSDEKRAEEPVEETPAAEEADDGTLTGNAEDETVVSHVYSHRGSAGDDELTFAAYDRAVEAGSKYIEADIVVSGDGTVYVAHDDYALDMTGTGGYLSGMTDGQIDKLKTKNGSNVLKLKDIFEKYGDSVNYIVDVKKIKEHAVDNMLKAEKAANERVADANAKVAAAEAERDRQASLNTNLLRIIRERANAKRGLQPKKKHPGYRFSGKIMQTKTVRGHNRKEGTLYADVWTATIETPYDATIPLRQIEDRIFGDLRGADGILHRLGINYWKFKEDPARPWKGKYSDAVSPEDNPDGLNYLFDYKFMINPKSQLWEVQITTTKPIKALAEMM